MINKFKKYQKIQKREAQRKVNSVMDNEQIPLDISCLEKEVPESFKADSRQQLLDEINIECS